MSAHVRAALSRLRLAERRVVDEKTYDRAVELQIAQRDWVNTLRRNVISNDS